MELHDPHSIPQPLLVFSGLLYLIPGYIAYKKQNTYTCASSIILAFTSVGFHGTRHEYFFVIDAIAMLNYVFHGASRAYFLTEKEQFVVWFSIVYGFVTHIFGKKYNVLSFDPNWNLQMFFHSLIHIFSSYAACKVLDTQDSMPI